MDSQFPDADIQDLKAMSVEFVNPNATSAREILASVTRAEPLNQDDVMLPLASFTDSWVLNSGACHNMPGVEWNQLYQLGVGIPLVKKGKAVAVEHIDV